MMGAVPAVELRALAKSFGGVVANRNIDLRVAPGTVHAIIGENGAGKSTAMKMLYGIYAPDAGEILVDGVARSWRTPADAIASGIGMVHQHFMLAGPYTTLENLMVGAEPAGAARWLPRALRPIGRAAARAKLEGLAAQYGLDVPLDARVEDLSVGIQQRIEILKLLYRDARILILDEPTAVLTPQETNELFANLRRLRAEGKTILIITHKLKEVMALADRATVFRAGSVVGEVEIAGTSVEELASLMVGRKVSLRAEAPPPARVPAGVAQPLRVRDLSLRARSGFEATDHALHGLSFDVRGGEVVGIAGVEGNGQSELLQLLVHPRDFGRRASGSVRILDQEVAGGAEDGREGRAWKHLKIRDLGVGVIPEDRHREGLLLGWTVRQNFLLGLQRHAPFARRGLIDERVLGARVADAIGEYDVRPASAEAVVGGMSGGNQQKVIIAREFQRRPRLLIAAQPTRGVDVGAIEFIHSRILRARSEGAGILLVSSELDEILALSDRILVMFHGRIVAEFARGAADETALGICMGGGAAAADTQGGAPADARSGAPVGTRKDGA